MRVVLDKWNNIRIEDALIVIQPNMILGLDDKDNFTYCEAQARVRQGSARDGP